MIQKSLVDMMFRSAFMKRWTDRVRPIDFTVLGKQAHLMTAVWILGRHYEDSHPGQELDWPAMVEGGLFSLLEKCVVSDIKSQVFDLIVEDETANDALTTHVEQELKDGLSDVNGALFGRLRAYLANGRDNQAGTEYAILRAASWLASEWEWRLIESWGDQKVFSPDKPGESLTQGLINDPAMAEHVALLNGEDSDESLRRLWDLCGRLRFQDRWTQTPIVPRRPVLDHGLVVAALSYLSVVDEADSKEALERGVQNFFAGLFHDMAEVSTRDIINPVKNVTPAVAGRVEQLEREFFDNDLLPLVPDGWRPEFEAFVLNPFKEAELHDGRIIKGCDIFAAFMEAYYSVKCGTYSPWLKRALLSMFEHRRQYSPRNGTPGVDFEVVYELCFYEIEPVLRSIE